MSSEAAAVSNGAEAEAPPVPQLTEHQVKLIEETWKLVEPDLQGAGLMLFFKLFEIAPDLQELFPFSGQELTEENEKLKKHALQVMEAVGAAVGLLHDPAQLEDVLIELGIVHNLRNVQPVGQALVYTLSQGLQDKFTDEVKEAWVTLYTIVQHYMQLGMTSGLDV